MKLTQVEAWEKNYRLALLLQADNMLQSSAFSKSQDAGVICDVENSLHTHHFMN